LQLDELSLVDRPANASIDPRTGKKINRSVVVLYKRDNSNDGDEDNDDEKDGSGAQDVRTNGGKMDKENFIKVMKSASTREAIVENVTKRATEIAKKKGISLAAAEARVWKQAGVRAGTSHAGAAIAGGEPEIGAEGPWERWGEIRRGRLRAFWMIGSDFTPQARS
jgi:hypothetical protein